MDSRRPIGGGDLARCGCPLSTSLNSRRSPIATAGQKSALRELDTLFNSQGIREPGSEKKSRRNPNQMSIERREFLKTAGCASAGMATGVVLPSQAIAQKTEYSPRLGITYINIADYGNVYPGANITPALQAALNANGRTPVTGQPGDYTGVPKVYLIPDPGVDHTKKFQDPLILDGASISSGLVPEVSAYPIDRVRADQTNVHAYTRSEHDH